MKDKSSRRMAGFSTVELIVALLLFSGATASVLVMSKSVRDHSVAAVSAGQQNAYATFQSQVALQGINPAIVGNPLQAAIEQQGTAGTPVSLGTNTSMVIMRNQLAAFEVGAVSQPAGAQRNLGGSARVDAVNYSVASAGKQATRGAGIGFSIETIGPAAPVNAIPLAPPSFNIQGDITAAPFPLDDIALLPSSNPPGTTYRYTTDGSALTASSPLWDNNPGWTPATFPAQVSVAAFNTDPQYAPSVPATASYSMQLSVTYGRADGRTMDSDGFSWSDLASAAATGIVLSENIPGFSIVYTLDGSDPRVDGVAYGGPFVPAAAQFVPTVLLRVAAVSSDPRIATSTVTGYSLSAVSTTLSAPTFLTDNSQPLAPGTPVVISAGSNATTRTEVNNGTPSASSSQATSFPLN